MDANAEKALTRNGNTDDDRRSASAVDDSRGGMNARCYHEDATPDFVAPAVAQFLNVKSRLSIDGYPSIIDARNAFEEACRRYEASVMTKANRTSSNDDRDENRSFTALASFRRYKVRITRPQTKETDGTSHVLDGASDSFSNFITHTVARYLGVRSLLSFGATCKSHRIVMSKEIERRKARIEKICTEIRRLMASQKQSVDLTKYIKSNAGDAIGFDVIGLEVFDSWINFDDARDYGVRDDEDIAFSNPTREDVSAAKTMALHGIRLIDDELFTIHSKGASKMTKWSPAHRWDYDMYGIKQRSRRSTKSRIFDDQDIFRREKDAILSLRILHNCFYSLNQGAVNTMPRGLIRKACRYVTIVCSARLFRIGYEVLDPNGCYELTGSLLAQEGIIDAFRVAAREYIFMMPKLMGCFRHTINKASYWHTINGASNVNGRVRVHHDYENCYSSLWEWIFIDDANNYRRDDDDDIDIEIDVDDDEYHEDSDDEEEEIGEDDDYYYDERGYDDYYDVY